MTANDPNAWPSVQPASPSNARGRAASLQIPQLLETSAREKTDLRTAALGIAIDKIAVSYAEMGIFP